MDDGPAKSYRFALLHRLDEKNQPLFYASLATTGVGAFLGSVGLAVAIGNNLVPTPERNTYASQAAYAKAEQQSTTRRKEIIQTGTDMIYGGCALIALGAALAITRMALNRRKRTDTLTEILSQNND